MARSALLLCLVVALWHAHVPCASVRSPAQACAIWGMNDECNNNPAHMHNDCPVTCGVCSNFCQVRAAALSTRPIPFPSYPSRSP